jgi:hypothetical protein
VYDGELLAVDKDIISLDDAVALAFSFAEQNFPDIQDSMLRDFASLLTYMAGENRELSVKELYYTMDNLGMALADGDARLLAQPRGLRVRRVADIQEFVESKFYMGQRGYIRPRIMEELWNLFHGEHHEDRLEVVLGGGIGWGKSFMAEMGMAYMLYRLSCYHSPQIEFGLAPGSSMYFIMQSVTLELATKVLFGQFGQRVRRSEYFSKYFPIYPKILSELRFPNAITIMPLSSADTSALGLNVFGGCLDELNFMNRVLKPSVSRFTGEAEYDQAEKLHTSIIRRMKSRFQVRGRVPGKLFLISSANYPGDFIDRKIQEAADETAKLGRSNIFVVRMAQWESLPADKLSGETFPVEVGDAYRASRILDRVEDSVEPESVIQVPMEYFNDFQKDLEAAIRDLAGIPIGAVSPFIRARETIETAGVMHDIMFEGNQLFVSPAVDLTLYADRLQDLINDRYFTYTLDDSVQHFIHIDLALTSDSCGLAVAHFSGFKQVGKSLNWDAALSKYVEIPAGSQPSILVDGILEIVPPKVDEIDINLIGDLIEIINSRICIGFVTSDSFQYAMLLQRVRRLRSLSGKKVRAMVLSVDRTITPYAEVKQSLRDARLIYPNVEKVKKELRELILDSKTGKIDHPVGGSKDLSDAVSGVTYAVVSRYTNKDLRHHMTRLYSPDEDNAHESAKVSPVSPLQPVRERWSMRVH